MDNIERIEQEVAGMESLMKDFIVSLINVILGGFLGIFMKFSYAMMHGEMQAVLGIVLFLLSIGVAVLYTFLLKKFVTGSEGATVIPTICLAIGVWISWTNYIG